MVATINRKFSFAVVLTAVSLLLAAVGVLAHGQAATVRETPHAVSGTSHNKLAPLAGSKIPAPEAGYKIPAPLAGFKIPAPETGLKVPAPLAGWRSAAPETGLKVPAPAEVSSIAATDPRALPALPLLVLVLTLILLPAGTFRRAGRHAR